MPSMQTPRRQSFDDSQRIGCSGGGGSVAGAADSGGSGSGGASAGYALRKTDEVLSIQF
jgi:hypothetical protein